MQDKFEIIALTAGANTSLLNEQIKKFKPKYAYAENINVKRLFLLGLIPAKLKKESSLILIISGLLKSIWAKKNWKVLKSKKSLRQ